MGPTRAPSRSRREVVTRRTKHRLNKARDNAHLQVGLAIAVANIDEVIRLIRTSPDAGAAREALMGRAWPAKDMAPLVALIADPRHNLDADGNIHLSEAQARAILDLRLQRLTALGRDEIAEALNKLAAEIADYLETLRSREKLFGIVKSELIEVREAHATPRRTIILDAAGDMEDEDLIQREDMVVTVSHAGYIKRVPLSTYRAQRRGGKGRSGMQTRDEDFVARLFVASTHAPVLFFSSHGHVYKEKVWRLPLAAPQARGKAMVNMLPLDPGERITTIMPLPEDEATWESLDVMFATTRGTVRRNKLSDFAQVNRAGKIAMKLDEGEGIVDVAICSEADDVLLTTAEGQCIRFPVTDVRVFKGRDSMGVRGVALSNGDRVISLAILRHMEADAAERAAFLKMRRAVAGEATSEEAAEALVEEGASVEPDASLSQDRYVEMSLSEQIILTLSENGFGKRTALTEYRSQSRGGKGLIDIKTTERNGPVVAIAKVTDEDEVMITTTGGNLIRTRVSDINLIGRNTQGVRLIRVEEGDAVRSLAKLPEEELAVNEDGLNEGPGQGEDHPPHILNDGVGEAEASDHIDGPDMNGAPTN